MKAIERELDGKSKYLNEITRGIPQEVVLRQMEEDLVDVMVMCRHIVDGLRSVMNKNV